MTDVRRQFEVLIERPLIRHYLLPIPAMDPKRVDERKGSIANIESVCAAGVPSDEVIKSPWAKFPISRAESKKKTLFGIDQISPGHDFVSNRSLSTSLGEKRKV